MNDAEQDKLQRQAQEFWQTAKMHLIQSVQPGNPRAFAQGIDRSKLNHRSPYSKTGQGFSLPAGQMPSDTDVSNFINRVMGGNPYEKMLKASGGVSPTPAATVSPNKTVTPTGASASQPDPMALFNHMMMATQGKMDEANAANIARYDEGKGELGGLRIRNQERATNWGHAAQADIDERMKEALLNSEASLAARGLGGSTIQDAFRTRTARDTAREQQRVSEMRDSRLVDYDTRDTGNLVNFIERRDDIGPDYMAMLAMARQAGLDQQSALEREKAAEAMKQAQLQQASLSGNGGRGIPTGALVRSGPRGGAAPMWMGANPVQMAQGYLGALPLFSPLTTNRVPTPRGQNTKGREAKKVKWHKKKVLPTYKVPTPPLQLPHSVQGPLYA